MGFKSTCTLIKKYQSMCTDDRGHGIVLDLPPTKGGYDQGTSAVELAVESLNGCIVTIYSMKALQSKVKIEHMVCKMSAEMGEETISKVDAVLEIKSDADESKLQDVLEQTLAACPVGVLFRKSGCEINVEIKKK